jgi:hypothetical protein
MIGGGVLVVGVVWFAGRSVRHTVYRPRRWTVRDTLVVVGCGLALVAVVLPPVGRDTLYYSPYPRLTLPVFDPLVGLGLLGLLAPAVGGLPSVPPASRGEETTDLVDLGAAPSPPREGGGAERPLHHPPTDAESVEA